MKKIPGNSAAFKAVEDSLFNLTIDLTTEISQKSSISTIPRKVFLDCQGIWLDKALSFVIFKNGEAALNGEVFPW